MTEEEMSCVPEELRQAKTTQYNPEQHQQTTILPNNNPKFQPQPHYQPQYQQTQQYQPNPHYQQQPQYQPQPQYQQQLNYPQYPNHPEYYPQPQKKKSGIIIALWAIIGLLLLGLIVTVIFLMNKQSKEKDNIAQMADSIAKANEAIRLENEALENENSIRIRKEAAIADAKKREKALKINAYTKMKTLLDDASTSYDYTDDLGFRCWRVGEKYYIHDINRDGIPEVLIYYNKYYESDLPNETILDCYWYNANKGKVECIYNRLNKTNPSYKGQTVYTYGNGSYDKIVSTSSGYFSVSKDIYNGYPTDDTYLSDYSMYDLEPLRMAFDQ